MKRSLCFSFPSVFVGLLLTFLTLFLSGQLSAQVLTIPYFCGFEDAAENANWTMAKGTSYANNWAIGTAVFNYGTHSLYVSHNNGANAAYTNSRGSAIAYRSFTLAAGVRYIVDYDWMSLGNGTDEMYVCWVTDNSENISAWANNNNGVPAGVKSFAKSYTATSDTAHSGVAVWRHGSFEVVGTGSASRLVFFWTSSQAGANNPGGCIDNVQINEKNGCPKPTNVQFNMSTTSTTEGFLTWRGNGTSWDVRYKNSNDSVWTEHTGLTVRVDTITGLSKGIYTFWVRTHCGNDSSSWEVLTNVLVYTSLSVCVNYIDLDASTVTCTTGPFANPYATQGKVDYGSASKNSRHTIHYGQGEYDPRTGNQLATVPFGEVASVRLGNWEFNATGESITYEVYVDASATILLLKYAVVLEDPSNHGSTVMPRFKLEILDSLNRLVDPSCGSADFIPGSNTTDWNAIGGLLWKDWTTMGLNLQSYVGQTLKVRFTTLDCDWGGHYGYAYFTLDCAQADLEGETCGGATTTTIRAPEGFEYEWYKVGDTYTVVSTDRNFTALQNDTSDYYCKVLMMGNPNCWFTLQLSLIPKWPISRAVYSWAPENCKNYIQFNNQSFINSNRGITQDVPSKYYWELSDGRKTSEVNPKMLFPNAGGTYTMALISSMAEDQCLDTAYYNINVPPLQEYDNVIHKGICDGGSYVFNKQIYTETGVYVDSSKTYAGCDSITTLYLTKYSEFTTHVYDTICEGMSYNFNGRLLSQPGTYVDTLLSSDRCDSIVTLDLVVNPVLSVSFDPLAEICADDTEFKIDFTPSIAPTHYEVSFGALALAAGFVDQNEAYVDNTITIPLPSTCMPDYYTATLTFYDTTYNCGNTVTPISFAVLYPDSIIKQKFNNVLALTNTQYNGGFTYAGYQWYKNNVPLPGQTGSYLYLGEGAALSAGDEYRVAITRADGSTLMSCPYTPKSSKPQIGVYPTIVGSNERITITIVGKGIATLWSTGGILLRTFKLDGPTEVIAPSEEGIYLLQVIDDESKQAFRVVVSTK